MKNYTIADAEKDKTFFQTLAEIHPSQIAGCESLLYIPRHNILYLHFAGGRVIVQDGIEAKVSIVPFVHPTKGSDEPERQIESIKNRLENFVGVKLQEIVAGAA